MTSLPRNYSALGPYIMATSQYILTSAITSNRLWAQNTITQHTSGAEVYCVLLWQLLQPSQNLGSPDSVGRTRTGPPSTRGCLPPFPKPSLKTKTINVTYEDTTANLADLLTKGKPKVPHTDNTLKVLGMKPLAWWHYGVFSTRSFPQKFSSLYLLRDLL